MDDLGDFSTPGRPDARNAELSAGHDGVAAGMDYGGDRNTPGPQVARMDGTLIERALSKSTSCRRLSDEEDDDGKDGL